MSTPVIVRFATQEWGPRPPRAHQCLPTRRGSLSSGCSSYWRESCRRGPVTIVCRWPLHGHWPHVHSVHTHKHTHTSGHNSCPCPEERLKASRTQAEEGGTCPLWKTPWRWNGSILVLVAPGGTWETNLPLPSPYCTLFLVATGRPQLIPCSPPVALFCNVVTDTRGSRKLPAPAPALHILGGSSLWEALPFLVPPLQPLSGQNRDDGPNRGWVFPRAHWSGLLAREVLHALQKPREWNGTMFRENPWLCYSYTWNRSTKINGDVPIAANHVCFPILVSGVEDPVSSVLEVKLKGGVCVCVFLRPREFL